MTDAELAARVLALFDKYELYEFLWWRTGKRYGGGEFRSPASFFVNCNDLFYWGCADCEEITPENVAELERALADAESAEKYMAVHGGELFCCRLRKMRPQGAYYNRIPEALWPLFDACGPEREVGGGNPHRHPLEVPQ